MKNIRLCAGTFVLTIAVCFGCGKKADSDEGSKGKERSVKTAEESVIKESEDVVVVASEEVGPEPDEDIDEVESIPEFEALVPEPFYGIFLMATKDEGEAIEFSDSLYEKDIFASILVTSDWENLNSEPWYVVYSGQFDTEEVANEEIEIIKDSFPDAYVKYTGEYIGNSEFNTQVYIFSVDCYEVHDSYIIVTADISGVGGQKQVIIDANTVFDDSCDMSYFTGYEDGMSVLDWIKSCYYADDDTGESAMAIMGVLDVNIEDCHVNTVLGTYWWD